MSGSTRRRYPVELKTRAVRMVTERPGDESEWAAIERIASLLGIGTAETLRTWVRRSQAESDGVDACESAELRRLRRENAELKRANAILKAASSFFAAELDRPRG